jgi:predicted Zn-dependent protease
MKRLLAALAVAAPGLAAAEPLLDFRSDLAFRPEAVQAFAESRYRARIRTLEAQGRLDTDPALLARLGAIVSRLRAVAAQERPDMAAIAWELHACRGCGENASATAGGKLLVGEEFLQDLAADDDELAFLVAHEMAHVLAEHTREFATAARYFVSNGLRREYWDIQRELDESLGANLRMAPVAAHQELEADYIGCVLAASAGYDPRGMLTLLRKLEPGGGVTGSTHPERTQRLRHAEALLPSAAVIRARGFPLP